MSSYFDNQYGGEDPDDTQRTSLNRGNKYQTLTDMKSHLLGDATDGSVYSSNQKRKNLNENATEMEMEKMK